jgi:hypothetical protein
MASLKIEFLALDAPVPISAVTDGTKADKNVTSTASAVFEPKESLTVNYNKWNAGKLKMTMNGKSIVLPAEPLDPKAKRIEFTISKDNLAQIWSTGSITGEPAPPPPDANVNVNANVAPTNTAPVVPRPTPPPAKPANTAANAATNVVPKPAANARPAANTTMMTSKTPKP